MTFSTFTKVLCAIAALVVLVLVFFGIWQNQEQAMFTDLTVELGCQSLSVWDFLEGDNIEDDIAFISDVSKIDLGTPGTTAITLRNGKTLQTVKLTVADTTAPEVVFIEECTLGLGQELQPADFVESVSDLSPVTVSFVTPFQPVDTYSDQTLEVAVTDKYGNATVKSVVVHFDWMRENVTLELGTPLTRDDILLNASQDWDLISQDKLDEINACGVGKYTLPIESGYSMRTCSITVQDTTPPALELQEVAIYPNEECSVEDFIVTVSDISGHVDVELLSRLPFGQEGTHTVQILATDENGLQTTKNTTLRIYYDLTAPSIYGLYDINIKANSAPPDYEKKVWLKDGWDGQTDEIYEASQVPKNLDGQMYLTYDASQVDLEHAGVYYVRYTATDTKGNIRVANRKVMVSPDYEDTERLIEDIAKSLTKTDPESLRDFVRSNIIYIGQEWGGNTEDEVITYGFTRWRGNCYVHAMCLKALLDYFGYENELIWLMPQYTPHYWNLVKIDGVWYHIDSTPAVSHSKYSLMNNQQRLSTLKGRRWDTSKWTMLNEETQ